MFCTLLSARGTSHSGGCVMQIALTLRSGYVQRQKELVRVFYVEVAALEDVLEEAVYALGTDARTILVQIRKCVRRYSTLMLAQQRIRRPGTMARRHHAGRAARGACSTGVGKLS